MTVIAHRRTTDHAPRLHRRHEIVTRDGVDGVVRIATTLSTCGYQVRDFSADVREGVQYSAVICTVALTNDECGALVDRLLRVPAVVSVDPC